MDLVCYQKKDFIIFLIQLYRLKISSVWGGFYRRQEGGMTAHMQREKTDMWLRTRLPAAASPTVPHETPVLVLIRSNLEEDPGRRIYLCRFP